MAHATAWSESPGESVVRWAALALGLPEPICQHPFTRADGRHFYLDLFWEGCNAGLEYDGHLKYRGEGGVDALVAEKARDDEIRTSGIRLGHLDVKTANNTRSLVAALMREIPQEAWVTARPRQGLWSADMPTSLRPAAPSAPPTANPALPAA